MSDFRLVFVGGIGRSGSTLLERLLGELPGVCAVGEVVHLWRRGLLGGERCGCGTPFRRCAFWQEVGEDAFGGWDRIAPGKVLALQASVDRTRFVPRLLAGTPPVSFRRRVLSYTGLYHRLYTAVARRSGCGVVVDSSKHASLAACLRWRYGTGFQVLHVVRDPRAVAYSWLRRVRRPDAVATGPEGEMARYAPGWTAVQWVAQNAVFAALERRGVPTRRLRYEDLVAAPVAEFRAVSEFLGCGGPLPFVGARTARLSGSHAVSGNPMRHLNGDVPIRGNEAWRENLAWRHRLVVSTLTAPFRSRYGY